MENIIWKTKSFEKNKHESQVESFKILEIEKFLKQALKRKNFDLHDYRLNISNTKINILISNYEKKDTNTRNILTIEKQKNFWLTILKTINRFTNNKFQLNLKIKRINKQFLTKTVKKSVSNQSYKLKQAEMKNLYKILFTQKNSAEILGLFITNQLKLTKRHNFFLNSLIESLTFIIKQKYSKVEGIKILIKGRLNNAPRSNKRIIKLNKIPLQTTCKTIDYSEAVSFTQNGTIGVKIWINQKHYKNVFTTKKNEIQKN